MATLLKRLPVRKAAGTAWFTYGVQFTAIAPGTQQPQTITIDNDADFEASMAVYFATTVAAPGNQTLNTLLVPSALVAMETQDTQRVINRALPINMIFGDARQPLVLPEVRRFGRRSIITLTVTNQDPAATLNLWLGFVGRKVYA